MPTLHRISPCLWFDDQAEQAANFYTSVFPNARIVTISHYGEAGTDIHGREPGSVMTVAFELDGQLFTALNGGPVFTFNEAISFQIYCDTQEEIDHYWTLLKEGGPIEAQQCGWLKDRYGVSWQVVPRAMAEMVTSGEQLRTDRVMTVMLGMKKLDLERLQAAFDGSAI
jgi:predicted 3-demethylubiquinone-9 3-methyltransferase (glyoxalase superfamily)